MPAITELMNTFTVASAVCGTTLTASPPRDEHPGFRPNPVQMPLAGAAEGQVNSAAFTMRLPNGCRSRSAPRGWRGWILCAARCCCRHAAMKIKKA
jgi:hypothetical protein